MRALFCLLFVLCTSQTFAQYYKDYDWKKKPKLHTISDKEAKTSSVGILEKHIVEYEDDVNSDNLKKFETVHTITRVNDDKGIQTHNTVYIPMYDVKQILDIKARTINPKGKITLLDKNNIKEVKNVEEYGDFKIFAIEGVEKNSEIEMLYTLEKEYSAFGRETIQKEYPIQTAEYTYITGELAAKIKAYGTDAAFTDTTLNDRKSQALRLQNIPAMVEEEYASPDANKINVVYQCFGKGNPITHGMLWNNVVNNLSVGLFPEEALPEAKEMVNGILSAKDTSDYAKAYLIDDYIKTNFTVIKNNNEQLSDINYILKNRSASDLGILQVYAQLLKAAEVQYLTVITANRYEHKFDPEFFNPGALREFLIYIPTVAQYIIPDRIEYRLGEAPAYILGNPGLFTNSKLEYSFYKITLADDDYSRVVRNMNISFGEDMENVTLSQYQEYYGHWSTTNRAVMNLAPEESIKEFEEYLTGQGIEDKVVNSYSIENKDIKQLTYNTPFIVKANITSESLLEEAGDSYIFQVGKVIGTQSELYQETERVNPIEMQYPNQYDYTITVTIPDDYTAEGLESLQIKKELKDEDGKQKCKFESNYKIEGNKIIITIQEFYKENEYPVTDYDEFRAVINAASDFNKAAILFNPKE